MEGLNCADDSVGKVKDCPCGSAESFARCCEPYILGRALPVSAGVLMRSRYLAYILKDEAYLLSTWAMLTRPAKLDFDGDATRWEGLSILGCERGKPEDDEGTVEFVARYRVNGEAGQLHERSSFVRESGRWAYLRGEMLPEVDFSKTGRNDLCPCGSGRKFKKCCGA